MRIEIFSRQIRRKCMRLTRERWYRKGMVRFIAFFCFLVILPSCTSLTGNVSLHRSVENFIYGAWKDSEKKDSEKMDGVIRKQGEGDTERYQDSFTIYFNQAFFKYLPDFGDSSEVVIIFRFTEISGKEDGGEIVKILGPLKRMGDGSFFPGINKVAYGPKKLSSDVLSVEINVLEFDAGERMASTALLDFVTNAASALAIADPVTQVEVKVAKEVANTLLQFNQNDPIMDIHFDLLPYDENVKHWKSANNDVSPIPLKTGNYVIIKEEQCRFMGCYFQFTERDRSLSDGDNLKELPTYLLSIPADILTAPLVALNRTFLDTPDKRALSPIGIDNTGKIKTRDNYILLDNDTKKLYLENGKDKRDSKCDQNPKKDKNPKKLYTDKSWITFSIEQGRDPSLWELRKSLSNSEKEINELLKNRSIVEIIESSRVDDVIEELKETKKKIQALTEKNLEDRSIVETIDSLKVDDVIEELKETKKKIQALTEKNLEDRSIVETIDSSKMDDVIEELKETKKKIQATKEKKIKYLGASASYIGDLDLEKEKQFCVSKPKDSNIQITNFTGNNKLDIAGKLADSVEDELIDVKPRDQTPGEACYTIETVGSVTISEGEYKINFQVQNAGSDHFESQTIDYYFVYKPKIKKLSTSGDKNVYELTMYDKIIDKIIVQAGDNETTDYTITDKENGKIISIPGASASSGHKLVLKMKYGLEEQECELSSGQNNSPVPC